jgi:signal peptidase I
MRTARWIDPEPDATSFGSMTSATLAAPRILRFARARLGIVAKLGLLLALFTGMRAMLGDQYLVPTTSMSPTIAPGDHIFVHKAAYGARLPFTDSYLFELDGPARGDVVLFSDPRGGKTPLVKRVVAFEGEEVAMRDGTLLVDGRPQALERLPDGNMVEHLEGVTHESGPREREDFGPVVVPSDHLFVLGDNRPASLDSRFIGTIPRRLLRGRVVGIVYGATAAGLDGSRVLREIR